MQAEWLTVEGEFVVKNMVLVAAGLVVAGYEVQPLGGREGSDACPPGVEGCEEESLAS